MPAYVTDTWCGSGESCGSAAHATQHMRSIAVVFVEHHDDTARHSVLGGMPNAHANSVVRVRDVMTHQVISIDAEASIESALWSFREHDISGAPVRDATGRVVGVLSKSDVVDPMRNSEARKVKHVMNPVAWSVKPSDPAIDAVKLMVDKGIHRILVAENPGRLEGIVTTMNIMRALAQGKQIGDF